MASTLAKLLVHVTFSTKDRVASIPERIEPDLYSYIGGIWRQMGSPLLAMGGASDHVHMLVSLGKTVALSDLLLNVKRDSSRWMKDAESALSTFGWQDGYFAFSIGESGVDALRAYIANQKEHHKTIDFKDEVRAFLCKYGIEWYEQYVWD